MASSFTTSFGIEKIATGEQAGVWGTTTNFNIDILDRIASFTSVALSGTTQTLTVREASPGAGTENLQDGMYRVIKFTGALGGNNTVTIAPNTSKAWFIFENATTDSGSSGPYSVILTQGAGANITVQNGKNAIVYCDGAGSGAAVFNALNDLQIATLEVTGAAAVDGLLTAGASVAVTGNVTTTGTVEPAGDTAADDNAAIGYTAGEGLILTGQGSTNDVTIKNDADGEVMGVLTGSTTAAFTGQVTATGFTGTLDGILGSGTAAAVSATTIGATGLVTAAAKLDLNGTELILDADADTSITADTDDTIDIRIAGADDFQFTANTFTAAASSVVALDDGVVATPALTNTGDLNTGLYFPAADTVGVVTGGTEQFRFGSNPIPGANKNVVINGSMQICQRATSTAGVGNGDGGYVGPDQWFFDESGSPDGVITVSQETGGGVGGQDTYTKILCTTEETLSVTTHQMQMHQRLEAQNCVPLKNGAAGIAETTISADVIIHADGSSGLSFPVKVGVSVSTVDGTARQCVGDWSIAANDTWETVSITLPADSTATFVSDSNIGGYLRISLAAGSARNATNLTWANDAADYNTSSSDNILDQANNYIGYTRVQWEVGAVATDFAYENVSTLLQKCYRYYERLTPNTATNQAFLQAYNVQTTTASGIFNYTHKRAAPTITFTAADTFEVRHEVATAVCTAVAVSGSTDEDRSLCNFTVSSGLTAGSGCVIRRNGTDTTFIEVSAEL